jgi:hypothetical protein
LVDVNPEDVERLGSRLAMVVSEDGEAENAGRALGQLARRLGLTGGQLKAMFVAGAAAGGSDRQPRARTEEVERLEREIATLRHSLLLFEENATSAARERDALLGELGTLRSTLFRIHANARVRVALGIAVLLAVALAGAVSYLMVPAGPAAVLAVLPPADQDTRSGFPAAVPATPPRQVALVHTARAVVFKRPDPGAPVVAVLPAGKALVVRRLLWNMMIQWAEVEIGGGIGYIEVTDIDMT